MQRHIVILHADACIGTQTLTIVTNNNPRTTVYRTVIHRDNELVIALRNGVSVLYLFCDVELSKVVFARSWEKNENNNLRSVKNEFMLNILH